MRTEDSDSVSFGTQSIVISLKQNQITGLTRIFMWFESRRNYWQLQNSIDVIAIIILSCISLGIVNNIGHKSS